MKEAGIVLVQYGALGAIVIAMGWYIIYLHKERNRERKESAEVIQKQFERMHAMADTQNEITQENTSVLSALKTLLELDIKLKK